MTHKKIGNVELDRDLNSLNEAELKQIFYSPGTDPTRVKLIDRFERQDIIDLHAHPQWEQFSEEFKEMIRNQVCEFLAEDVAEMREKEAGTK